MASHSAKNRETERREEQRDRSNGAPASNPIPLTRDFQGGTGPILNPQQWLTVVGGLQIAAGVCARENDYRQMFDYSQLAGVITAGFAGNGSQLIQQGAITQTATGVGAEPPPLTRAAGAG